MSVRCLENDPLPTSRSVLAAQTYSTYCTLKLAESTTAQGEHNYLLLGIFGLVISVTPERVSGRSIRLLEVVGSQLRSESYKQHQPTLYRAPQDVPSTPDSAQGSNAQR